MAYHRSNGPKVVEQHACLLAPDLPPQELEEWQMKLCPICQPIEACVCCSAFLAIGVLILQTLTAAELCCRLLTCAYLISPSALPWQLQPHLA